MNASDDWKPSYFSLQRRCQGCGTKLTEPPPEKCPHCDRSLQDVGIWSQFTEWEQERKQGRWQFVLRESLWFLFIVPVGWLVNYWFRGNADWERVLISGAGWIVAGVLITVMRWQRSEADYAEWKKRQPQ